VVFGLFALNLDKIVASKEELGDVAAIVVSQVKLSSWVLPFIAVQIENEVVKDNKLPASFHRDIDFFWSEGLELSAVYHLRGFDVAERELIANPVNSLCYDHHQDEGEKASKSKKLSLITLQNAIKVFEAPVCDCNVADQKHEVASKTMDFCDDFDLFLFSPIFVAVVKFHNAYSKNA
jgi:hypothetical protein